MSLVTKINNLPISDMHICNSDIFSLNVFQDIFQKKGLCIDAYNKHLFSVSKEQLAFSLECWPDTLELFIFLKDHSVHAKYLEVSMNSLYYIYKKPNLFYDAVKNNDFDIIVSGLEANYENLDNIYMLPKLYVESLDKVKAGLSDKIVFYEFEINSGVEDPWRQLSVESLRYPDDELLVSDILEASKKFKLSVSLNFSENNFYDIWNVFSGNVYGFHWNIGQSNNLFVDIRYYHDNLETFSQIRKLKSWEHKT